VTPKAQVEISGIAAEGTEQDQAHSRERPHTGVTARRSRRVRIFAEGKDFMKVASECGVSVWRNLPLAADWGAPPSEPCSLHRVDGVEGAFVLRSLLSPEECCNLVAMAECMGFTEAPMGVQRNVRRNSVCTWLVDQELHDRVFARLQPHLPTQGGALGAAAGLNARWRVYKYCPGDVFAPHTDGAWTGSGLDDSGCLLDDCYGDRASAMSCLVYLNSGFKGGETCFFPRQGGTIPVAPEVGAALCFFHGEHPFSPLHEGSLLEAGLKYVVRTDVLYMLPHDGLPGCCADHDESTGQSKGRSYSIRRQHLITHASRQESVISRPS